MNDTEIRWDYNHLNSYVIRRERSNLKRAYKFNLIISSQFTVILILSYPSNVKGDIYNRYRYKNKVKTDEIISQFVVFFSGETKLNYKHFNLTDELLVFLGKKHKQRDMDAGSRIHEALAEK